MVAFTVPKSKETLLPLREKAPLVAGQACPRVPGIGRRGKNIHFTASNPPILLLKCS
jgi:hypothetical protein